MAKDTFKDHLPILKVRRLVKVVVATGQLIFSVRPVNTLGLVVETMANTIHRIDPYPASKY